MIVILYILAVLLVVLLAFMAQQDRKSKIGKIVYSVLHCTPMVFFLVAGILADFPSLGLAFAFFYFFVWFFCYYVAINDK